MISSKIYGIIYLITNKQTNQKYIGATTKNISIRKSEHISRAKYSDYPIHKAIRNEGAENFTFEIVDVAFDVIELKKKENYYITSLKENGETLYNRYKGGSISFRSNKKQEEELFYIVMNS